MIDVIQRLRAVPQYVEDAATEIALLRAGLAFEKRLNADLQAEIERLRAAQTNPPPHPHP